VVVLFKLFAKTEKITMEDSRKANGMLKYRLYSTPLFIQFIIRLFTINKTNVIQRSEIQNLKVANKITNGAGVFVLLKLKCAAESFSDSAV
jgi:hypothetical protein